MHTHIHRHAHRYSYARTHGETKAFTGAEGSARLSQADADAIGVDWGRLLSLFSVHPRKSLEALRAQVLILPNL